MTRQWIVTDTGSQAREILAILDDEFGRETEVRQNHGGLVAIMDCHRDGDSTIDPAMPARFMLSWSTAGSNARRADRYNQSILGIAEAYGYRTISR